ncbi:PTS sugar transporter subunit IIC [Enterococcus gallinarum]|nr:PTS sugar transporter subunit IIC [Enterococcus gallinarum]
MYSFVYYYLLGFSLGSSKMGAVVNAIPSVITDGLSIATGMLPSYWFCYVS